jgi:hypothetical protein
LEQFHIDNTRSRHEDTDTVVCGLQVGSQQFPAQSFFAGDVNNGDHAVNLVFPSVFISDSASPVAFSYKIYNGDASKLSIVLTTLTNTLATQFIKQIIDKTLNPPAEPSSPADNTEFPSDGSNPNQGNDPFEADSTWFQALETAFVSLGSFLFPDCDGFVVAETIGGTNTQWDKLIDSAGGMTFRQTIRFPGADSPAGCGSNSDYSVAWTVTRKRVGGQEPFSLRQFLQANGVALHPGIRSLDPSAASISLKALMT